MSKTFLVFVVLTFVVSPIQAQQVNEHYIDSVLVSISQTETSTKTKSIRTLASVINHQKPEVAKSLFEYAIEQASNHKVSILPLQLEYGKTLSKLGQYDLSRAARKKGLHLAEEENNTSFIFDFNSSLAVLYHDLLKPDSIIYHAKQAEKIAMESPERYKDYRWLISLSYSRAYELLEDKKKQEHFLEETWNTIKDIPAHKQRGYVLYIILQAYKQQKNYVKQAKYNDLLVTYYQKKSVITPDFHMPIESIWFEKNTPENINDLKHVIEVSDSLNNYNSFAVSTIVLSELLINNEVPLEALPYLNRAQQKFDSISTPFEFKLVLYKTLKEAHLKAGNYPEAYAYSDTLNHIEDQIKSELTLHKIAEFEVKYDTEKKQGQIEKQKATKKLLYWILASIILILIIIVGFSYKIKTQNRTLNRKKIELESAINDKNLLLRETHHRVKNSFQIVSSLLYLQLDDLTNDDAVNAVKDAQNRIRSMTLIHQKLYSREQLTGINCKDYLTDLIADIMSAYPVDLEMEEPRLNIDDFILDIDTMTPIGLIVNELVTNALKHGYANTKEPAVISVEFERKEDHLVLKVCDNGKGMPLKIKENAFGIKLINALGRNLKAKINFSEATQSHGTMATLKIYNYTIL